LADKDTKTYVLSLILRMNTMPLLQVSFLYVVVRPGQIQVAKGVLEHVEKLMGEIEHTRA
jgi:hypothetical protein